MLRRAVPPGLVPAGLAFVCLALLVWRLWDGMSFLFFEDEAAHVLGAKALAGGLVLYRGFVDSHGPLIFALAQAYGALFGWAHPNGARVIPAGLALLATGSVAASPALSGTTQRLLGTAMFAGSLAAVWLVQGLFMLSFYPVAGALAVLGLAGFVAGAWRGRAGPPWMSAGAGLALALLGACAYSFWPTVALFAASGTWAAWRHGRGRDALWFAAGLGGGGALSLLYLWRFADPLGYLAFHIAESQAVYARYIGLSPGLFLRALLPSFAPDDRVQTLATLWAGGGVVALMAPLRRARAGWWTDAAYVLMGGAAVVLLNARGMSSFQDGAFVMAALGLASLALPPAVAGRGWRPGVAGAACAACLVAAAFGLSRQATYTPFHAGWATLSGIRRWPIPAPVHTPLFDRVRALVRPDERVLALAYQPEFYLKVDRLPMDGVYAWFRWDADYAASPWFGQGRDVCAAMRATPPRLVALNGYPIWGYDLRAYAPCLFVILARDYVHDIEWDDDGEQIFVWRGR